MTSQDEANLLLAEHQSERKRRLADYYAAERNAGASPLIANERLHFHTKHMDEYERDLDVLRQLLERT